MTEFDQGTYKQLKDDFVLVSKRILKENLSKNPETLKKYKREIINEHNCLLSYIIHYYGDFDTQHKIKYKTELIYIRKKITACFENLGLKYKFSKYLLRRIEFDDQEVVDLDTDLEDIDAANLTITELDKIDEESDEQKQANNLGENFENNSENNFNMTEEARNKFIGLCASTLSKYGGDPLTLDSFVNSIEFLEVIAGDHANILLAFIKTRLEGRALEAIPKENATITNIKSSLKNAIKPDNSKVVEGKILALRFDPRKAGEFTTEATKLAEAFQRSLIIEGIPQSKAKSMAVEKTVDLCRKSARSETVKAILASKDFNEPSDVIAKLIVEGNTEYQEKQILHYKQQRNGNNSNYKNRNNGNGNGKYNNNSNGNNKNNQGNYNNNNNNQNSGNYRGYSQNNGNNNRNQSNGHYYNNNNQNQNNRNSNQNSSYVRVASQGNEQLPSQERRAITYAEPHTQFPQ